MTVKRRSHGRNKKGRGHVNRVRCASTGKAIPKDKAIKRFIVRNIVDASSMRDIRDASAFETYALPKIYIKQYYCIEAAVHQRIVRSRSRTDRRNRDPPPRSAGRRSHQSPARRRRRQVGAVRWREGPSSWRQLESVYVI